MNSSSQQGNRITCDVLVIGSGLAGLSLCHQLALKHPEKSIRLISKASLETCNSLYAQGGIAASKAQAAALTSHVEDTLKAGAGLCQQASVEQIINHGHYAIEQLIALGVSFEKDGDHYALAKEGGHSERRIYYSGDQTGSAIMQRLLSAVKTCQNVTLCPYHIAVNLISQTPTHQPQLRAEIVGAYVLNEPENTIDTILANATVLATGGAGKTYRYTTNDDIATGDGVAMAFRAGCQVGNMEFYQFHPTLLYSEKQSNFLISEAVRGEGAYLRNGDTLERFMQRYAPEQLELATRDIVARAIFTEIEQSTVDFVYLDVRHLDKAFLEKRFPKIWATLADVGKNMADDLIPVVPAAHYQCGGIVTNVSGETALKRLYAIGEVAFTGLHGANRLASNSLLEAVVMANLATQGVSKDLLTPRTADKNIANWQSTYQQNPRRASQINAHWRGLRGEMTSYAGIVRTEAGLNDLLSLILVRKKAIDDYYWQHEITRDFIELRNIILTAEIIVRLALTRRESRGGHFREDYPNRLPNSLESITQYTLEVNHV